jgi:hypothetical protein
LRKYVPSSLGDLEVFLWFILTNVKEDYVAHWRVDCVEAYRKYLEYLAMPEDPRSVGIEMRQIDNFI